MLTLHIVPTCSGRYNFKLLRRAELIISKDQDFCKAKMHISNIFYEFDDADLGLWTKGASQNLLKNKINSNIKEQSAFGETIKCPKCANGQLITAKNISGQFI